MPSPRVSRYQDLLFRLRNSPAAIAATAGGIGLICGALVVAMTSGPSAPPSKVAQKPPVETTGTATSLKVTPIEAPAPVKIDTAAVSDCDRQTWPHITQQCLTEREAAQRKVRVISTDRIAPPVVSAIEQETKGARITTDPVQKSEPARETANVTPVPRPAASTPAPAPAPAPTPVATITPLPAPETKATPVIDRPATVAAPVVAPMVAPTPAPVARPTPALASQPQIAATTEQPAQAATKEQPAKAAANEKRAKNARDARDARDKRTREAKSRRAPVRDSDDDDAADYSPRSRVVERWTEREYMVPSEQSSQRRRVIVIRRGGEQNQNPFGSFFSSAFR